MMDAVKPSRASSRGLLACVLCWEVVTHSHLNLFRPVRAVAGNEAVRAGGRNELGQLTTAPK